MRRQHYPGSGLSIRVGTRGFLTQSEWSGEGHVENQKQTGSPGGAEWKRKQRRGQREREKVFVCGSQWQIASCITAASPATQLTLVVADLKTLVSLSCSMTILPLPSSFITSNCLLPSVIVNCVRALTIQNFKIRALQTPK